MDINKVFRNTFITRAGRSSLGTIVLSREKSELSRMILHPSEKKNKNIEPIPKNIETIIKRTYVERTEIA